MSAATVATCGTCDKAVEHVGPSLLVEGTSFWKHLEPPIVNHLIYPIETVILRAGAR